MFIEGCQQEWDELPRHIRDGIAQLQEEPGEASVAPPSVGVRSAWSRARMSSVVELDPRLYQPS
jgi:hypothetical protein